MQYLDVFARVVLGVVFAIAVYGKASGRAAFDSFVASLHAMRVLPARLLRPVAVASVVAEALVVVLVAVPLRVSGIAAFALAIGLLLVLTGVIVVSVRRGNRAPCRCFGASRTPLGARHVVRNALLLVVAAAGLAGALAAGPIGVAGGFLAVAAGLVTGILLTAFDDLAELVLTTRQ